MDSDFRILKLELDDSISRLVTLCLQDRLSAKDPGALKILLQELFPLLGGTLLRVKVEEKMIEVDWRPDSEAGHPADRVLPMLTGGRLAEAALLLAFMLADTPDDTAILYNLGMAYSDLGILDRAIPALCRLTELEPAHSNGMAALGVALSRLGSGSEAEGILRKAVEKDEDNPWLCRNLGGILLKQHKWEEAIPLLKKATSLNPTDDRAWFGLGQAQEATGDTSAADDAYRQVLSINEYGDLAEATRKARSGIATHKFRSVAPSSERMDAVMYLLGALERFEKMSLPEIKKVGFEIAMLGTKGLDINDPTPKYRIRSLEGDFSGLHLVCLEYAAFKQTDPGLDIGFDLSKEYASARAMRPDKPGQD